MLTEEVEDARLLRVAIVQPLAQRLDADAEIAHVVPLPIELAVDHDVADGGVDGEEAERGDRAKHHQRARDRALREPLAGSQRAHRSISPTTMSMEPSATIASGSEAPIAISRSSERLISEGARMWKRNGAEPPSETT